MGFHFLPETRRCGIKLECRRYIVSIGLWGRADFPNS